jgi:autophagy-related protein 11
VPHRGFINSESSTSERKRRQVYRGEIHGQLPFETRGMDETVPTIDFSPSTSTEVPYSLERPDLDGLCNPFALPLRLHCSELGLILMLGDIEKSAKDDEDEGAVDAVKECRSSLHKLISRMDNMESVFDRIAERLSR